MAEIDLKYSGEIGFIVNVEQALKYLRVNCTPDNFLKYKNKNGVTNSEILLDSYTFSLRVFYGFEDTNGNILKTHESVTPDMLILTSVVFFLDSKDVQSDVIINQSNLLVETQAFEGITNEQGKFNIELNAFYRDNIKPYKDGTPTIQLGSVKKQIAQPKVWIWCKTQNDEGKFRDYSIFDLTPFLQSVNIGTTETGGNFSLSLIPIDGFIQINQNFDVTGIWSPHKQRYLKFDGNSQPNFIFKRIIDIQSSQSTVSTKEDGTRYQGKSLNGISYPATATDGVKFSYMHSEVFFKNLISENDVVFIQMDPNALKDDEEGDLNRTTVNVIKKVKEDRIDDFFINCSNIKFHSWDLIGLVDTNSLSLSYEDNNTDVTVSGRDLMKLLLEDGTHFFAKSFANDEAESVFNNVNLPNAGDSGNASNQAISTTKKRSLNRLFSTGLIDMLYNTNQRNIQFVMNLLISRLANIEICPSEVFQTYSDKTEFLVPGTIYEQKGDESIKQSDTDAD